MWFQLKTLFLFTPQKYLTDASNGLKLDFRNELWKVEFITRHKR